MADQIKYTTLATLLQQHPGNVNYARIYESVDYDTPLLDRIPSEVIPGTSKQELISISIPLIGAVPYNAGTQTFRTDYKTVNAETHPYQGMIALDKKLVHANQAAAGQMMEREIRSGMRGIKANLERSLFYGKKISPYGMEGLVDQIGDYIALLDEGRFCFCMDKESLRERFVLLEGTEEQIHSLHSPKILAAVHEQYGSTALAEYPEPSMTEGLAVSCPTLAELLFYLRKGGCIS